VLIRAYLDDDLEAVVRCFGQSVRVIGARYYAPEQIAAWAPDLPDMAGWAKRPRAGGTFVADANGAIAGFVHIEDNGVVDLLYVHPHYERRGIGRELLQMACSWAMRHGAHRLESDVSIAARPLFELMGFRVETERSVERKGVRLRNFRMARNADAGQAHAPDG
jgi:putative acetyltransferase